VVGIIAYGIATLEGPLHAIKKVNALSHYTDWIIAHVHVGTLGWNGFLTFGMLYWLVPRLYRTELYSRKLAGWHFKIGFAGMLIYVLPLYVSGIAQALMLQSTTPEGFLQFPAFIDTVRRIIPLWAARAVGGSLYLAGAGIMVYNLCKTALQGHFEPEEEAEAVPYQVHEPPKAKGEHWHRWIESRPIKFSILALVAILIGSIVELVPTFVINSNIDPIPKLEPYKPLELEGRDIYIKEGCYNCHSQMVRPLVAETKRYGDHHRAGEFVYDFPFQWGSKRSGPDLGREGTLKLRKPDAWHYQHLVDPESMTPGSIMPPYPWLAVRKLDISNLKSKIGAMRKLGVPYEAGYEDQALDDLRAQAEEIAEALKQGGIEVASDAEIIALIAYLQQLGTAYESTPGVVE
jgi:cytochrome c oxidase cbb3-type subunit I/II